MLLLLTATLLVHTVTAALAHRLLVADTAQDGIFLVDSTDPDTWRRIPAPALVRPLAVSYDEAIDTVFFTGTHTDGGPIIGRVRTNGEDFRFRKLPQVSLPFTIALDPVSQIVFYADEGEQAIGIFSYDLLINKLIITTHKVTGALQLYTRERKLYFASRNMSNNATEIVEAYMDGTNLRVIYTMAPSSNVTDMAIDRAEADLYVVENGTLGSSIIIINLITLRKTVWLNIDHATSQLYRYLAVALGEQSIYISQYNNKTLLRYVKDTGVGGQFGMEPMVNSTVRNMAVVGGDNGAPDITDCADDNGGCEEFCLAIPAGRSCACREGHIQNGIRCIEAPYKNFLLVSDYSRGGIFLYDIEKNVSKRIHNLELDSPTAIDYADGYIYVSNQKSESILRGCLNGTCMDIITELATSSATPVGDLAIDPLRGNVYVAEPERKLILRVNAVTGLTQVYIGDGIDQLTSLTVDPYLRKLFWTEAGRTPMIGSASLDNSSERHVVVSRGIKLPTDMTLDSDRQEIYWCDKDSSTIEMSRYDGTHRRMVVSEEGLCAAIALDELYIYFSKLHSRSLYRVSRITGRGIESLRRPEFLHISDMVVVNLDPFPILSLEDNRNPSFVMFIDGERGAIYDMDLDGRSLVRLPVGSLRYPVSCDYDPTTELIFVIERSARVRLSPKTISRFTKTGAARFKTKLPERSEALGLTLDVISSLVYYVDNEEGTLGVYSMDFRYNKVLISNMKNLADIAIDNIQGKIFFTKVNPGGIMSADCTGENIADIISDDISSPLRIAVDHSQKMIYWTDDSKMRIERSTYSGSERFTLLSGSRYHAVSVDDIYLYFSVNSEGQLYRVLKAGGSPARFGPLDTNIQRISDISVFKPNIYNNEKNACSHNNGNCTQICLPNPSGRKCACDDDYEVDTSDPTICHKAPFKKVLLLTDRRRSGIFVVDTRTSAWYQVPHDSLYGVAGIDWDPKDKEFYWVDTHYKLLSAGCLVKECWRTVRRWMDYEYFEDIAVDYIERTVYIVDSLNRVLLVVPLEDPANETIIQLDSRKPRAVALDMRTRLVYWTDIGPSPSIQRASMNNGSGREFIINTNLSAPTDIALDVDTDTLFWCDGGMQVIERSSLTGENRRILFGQKRTYVAIAIDATYLYFSELFGSGFIFRIDKHTGQGLSSLGGPRMEEVFGMVFVDVNKNFKEPNDTGVIIGGSTQAMNTTQTTIVGIVAGIVLLLVVLTVVVLLRRRHINHRKNISTVPRLEKSRTGDRETNDYASLESASRGNTINNNKREENGSVQTDSQVALPMEHAESSHQVTPQPAASGDQEETQEEEDPLETRSPQIKFVSGSRNGPLPSGFGSTRDDLRPKLSWPPPEASSGT